MLKEKKKWIHEHFTINVDCTSRVMHFNILIFGSSDLCEDWIHALLLTSFVTLKNSLIILSPIWPNWKTRMIIPTFTGLMYTQGCPIFIKNGRCLLKINSLFLPSANLVYVAILIWLHIIKYPNEKQIFKYIEVIVKRPCAVLAFIHSTEK